MHCRKGCDYATGRMNDEEERVIAQNMCKAYANELYSNNMGELGIFSDQPKNLTTPNRQHKGSPSPL